MKALNLIFFIPFLFFSCKKDDVDTKGKTGNLKVSVNYYHSSSSSYYYYLVGSMEVELYSSNGSSIATQYTYGGTLDFGSYDYGTYTVKVRGTERETSFSTAQGHNSSFYDSQTFKIDMSTKTVSFKVP